jgi:hypothetical protein
MLKNTRDKKGWLLPYLVSLDNMFYKRWDYWLRIIHNDKIPQDRIPYIVFKPSFEYTKKEVQKNLKDCLNLAVHISNPLEMLIDWILWGFNSGESFPKIDERIDDYWYRNFNLGLFYRETSDHWAEIASEYMGRNNALGYFPTPGNVVEMMVKMTFDGESQHRHKIMSVMDPCCGTGIMLLYASNYSLNLYGNDVSLLLTKIAKVNAFTYVPWLAYRPKHLTIFDQKIEDIELNNHMKIPRCNRCDPRKQSFYKDLFTDHEITCRSQGKFQITKPGLDTDLVGKKLKAENISCAKCEKEEI